MGFPDTRGSLQMWEGPDLVSVLMATIIVVVLVIVVLFQVIVVSDCLRQPDKLIVVERTS